GGGGGGGAWLRLVDHRARPVPHVWPIQRRVPAAGAAARGASRSAVEHQRQQAERFGLAGQEGGDEPTEPDRFVGEPPPAWVSARDVVPATAEGGVDRFEDGLDPRWKLPRVAHLEPDARVAHPGPD